MNITIEVDSSCPSTNMVEVIALQLNADKAESDDICITFKKNGEDGEIMFVNFNSLLSALLTIKSFRDKAHENRC